MGVVRSLSPCILAHMLIDGLAVIMLFQVSFFAYALKDVADEADCFVFFSFCVKLRLAN